MAVQSFSGWEAMSPRCKTSSLACSELDAPLWRTPGVPGVPEMLLSDSAGADFMNLVVRLESDDSPQVNLRGNRAYT